MKNQKIGGETLIYKTFLKKPLSYIWVSAS